MLFRSKHCFCVFTVCAALPGCVNPVGMKYESASSGIFLWREKAFRRAALSTAVTCAKPAAGGQRWARGVTALSTAIAARLKPMSAGGCPGDLQARFHAADAAVGSTHYCGFLESYVCFFYFCTSRLSTNGSSCLTSTFGQARGPRGIHGIYRSMSVRYETLRSSLTRRWNAPTSQKIPRVCWRLERAKNMLAGRTRRPAQITQTYKNEKSKG